MSQGWHKVYGKDDVLIHCRQVKSDLYMYGIKKRPNCLTTTLVLFSN